MSSIDKKSVAKKIRLFLRYSNGYNKLVIQLLSDALLALELEAEAANKIEKQDKMCLLKEYVEKRIEKMKNKEELEQLNPQCQRAVLSVYIGALPALNDVLVEMEKINALE